MPGQSPGGLQQAPQMPPQRWQTPGLAQPHFSPTSNDALPPSYPHANHGPGRTGLPHASRPSPPFQSHLDPTFAGSASPEQFRPPTISTVAQQTFFNPRISAIEQPPARNTVLGDGEGFYAFRDQPQPGCCSSEQSTNWKHTRHYENQDVISEMLNSSPQTTIYRIPANLATYEHPMKPDAQADFGQGNPNYMQTVPVYAESGVIGTAALPADTSESTGCIVTTMHHCHCGPGCQCIACPVHPGNATTQAKVAEMHDLLDNEPSYTPTFETNTSWPSNQGLNENLPIWPHQAYDFPMLSNEEGFEGFRGPTDHGPHPTGQHWTSPVLIPQTQGPSRGSISTVPGYAHSAVDVGVPDGNNERARATPSQHYLYFQYPLPNIDGR